MDLRLRVRRLFANLFAPPFTSVAAEDLPETFEPRVVYLIGDPRIPWSAALVCPCGCKDIIQLSLIKNDNPRWRHRAHADGTISLDPSVWRTKGCHSHFILRRGRVFWTRGRRSANWHRRRIR